VENVTTLQTSTAAPRAEPSSRRRRGDIQSLRAVAVVLVVLFHLWPKRMTGGFVGVDVFFVISGFLITSHLIKDPPTSLRGVGAFWGRRVRRLLPAAFVVIVLTVVASWVFLPESQWEAVAHDAMASALYVENWHLAATATDYLAADGAPSPFQQFWSLSVEEQFYFLWPLLVVGVLALVGRRGRARRTVGAVIGVIFVGSLAASVAYTMVRPAAAYFVTYTRLWELALGGLLGVATFSRPGWFAWPQAVRGAVAWAALATMAWAAFTFEGSMAYPGAAALVPTVAAVAFLAARSEDGAASPQRVLGARAIQFTGDISYSVYLWHWPIIVIVPYVLGHALSWPDKLVVVVVAVVAGWASKTLIEDPPQRSRRLVRPAWTAALAAGGMIVVVALGTTQIVSTDIRQDRAAKQVTEALASSSRCLGAAAMDPADDCAGSPHGSAIINTPAQAAADMPAAYGDGCWSSGTFTHRPVCTYGRQQNPTARIALVGNSHAGHLLPALQKLADAHGWQITTYLVSACSPFDRDQDLPVAGAAKGCRDWARWAQEQTASRGFDLIVTSAYFGKAILGVPKSEQVPAATDAYVDWLTAWKDSGDQVLVIRDIPHVGDSVPDCVAEHQDDLSACDAPRAERIVPDPLAAAARRLDVDSIRTLDLTKYFCDRQTCYSTIGGLIAYFDGSHMTTAFATTLAPYLEPAVTAVLAR